MLTAPDATMLTAKVAAGGIAHIVMSHEQHALVFSAADLPTLPSSKCYELWLIKPGHEEPAGTLQPQTHAMSGPIATTDLQPGDRLGMTVEQASGAREPTTAMILDIGL